MSEAAARQEVQEPGEQLTPEQIEDLLYEEAAALVESESEDSSQFDQNTVEEDGQADPVEEAVAEDREETTSREARQTETAPPDPFADATPEQRQAYQNLVAEKARYEHDSMSNRNRVSALQKKLNDLEAKIQQQEQVKPAASKAEANLADDEDGTDLKEFQEDFPEIYKAVNKLYRQQVGKMESDFQNKLNQFNQQLANVSQPVEQIQQAEVDRYRQGQMEALATAHPDWRKIQDSQEFWGWVESQTEGVQALSRSVAANDNIVLLNLYKSQKGGQAREPAPRQAAPRRVPDVALPRTSAGGKPSKAGPPDGEGALDYWLDHWDDL